MKTTKPDVLLIHNATLDGSQDEYRVSARFLDGKYALVAGPFQDYGEAMTAYRAARRQNEVA